MMLGSRGYSVANSATKRPRLQNDSFRGGNEYPPPQGGGLSSRVLEVQGLSDEVVEADLVDALSHFGPVSYVSLSGHGTAMVEFEDIASADRCMAYSMNTDVIVMNRPAYFSYANMQSIPRQGLESERPSNVLIIYVQNPKYPITTDVMFQICKPIGQVNRIIINRRDGIQALVEFPDIETARMTKQRLNGCDIYSGCCTLKIEYAKLSRLNVTRNDQDQADYVAPVGSGDDGSGASAERYGLLNEPQNYGTPSDHRGMGGGRSGYAEEIGQYDDYGRPGYNAGMMGSGGYDGGYGGGMAMREGGYHSKRPRDAYAEAGPGPRGLMRSGGGGGGGYMDEYADQSMPSGMGPPSHTPVYGGMNGPNTGYMGSFDVGPPVCDGCGMGLDNAVLMVYGLNPDMVNCDKLFNVFCLYGNVVRIKFLKSKNDTVMIQMGDPVAAQRAIENLHNTVIFGSKMHVALSRQAQLNEVREPADLPDKTTSYKDYTNSRHQRFTSPEIAAKNRINPPQKFLYFFNAPPHVTEERLREVLTDVKAPEPVSVKIFGKKEMAKNSAGIIEFADEIEATEALMLCNHTALESPGSKTPFVMKLCYAGPANTSLATGMGGGRMGAGGYGPPMNGGARGYRPRGGPSGGARGRGARGRGQSRGR